MTKFRVALYGGNNNEYTIGQLEKLAKNDKILSDLHCIYCNCLLTFHHAGKRAAYLSTKVGCKHSDECDKKVHVAMAKERLQKKYVGKEVLSRAQQARLARAGYKAWQNRKSSIAITTKSKTSVSKHVTKKTPTVEYSAYRPVASSDGKVPTNDGLQKRHTRTPIVTADKLVNYIGQAVKVVGKIDGNVVVGKRKANITLYRDNQKVKLVLNEATFMNSAEGLTEALKELKKYIVNDGFNALACAVVDVIPDKKGNPVCMLRTDDAIVVNGYEMRMALHILRNTK